MQFRRVWVIQQRSSGAFLTPELYLDSSLKRAGRSTDPLEALDTASHNLNEDYEISSFFEEDK